MTAKGFIWNRKAGWLVCLALLLSGFPGFGQNARVEARLDTTALLIGDQTGLTVSFKGPANAVVEWPNLPDSINQGIQVIRRSKIDTTWSGDKKDRTLTQHYTITSFDTGFFGIPQIPVYYRIPPDTNTERAVSDMLFLKVTTLAVDTSQAIKPIKGPLRIPLTFREILPWILLGLAVAALIVAGIWYWKRRKDHKPILDLIPRVQLTADQIALKELEEIRSRKIWQGGRIKEYHTLVTDVLRKYIEARFSVPALESTSDEIIDGLRQNGEAGDQPIRILQPVLLLADLVKFAKANPVASENEETLDKAIEFIQITVPENKQ